MSFDTMALDERLLRAVRQAGYRSPTPIQEQAIPPALEGRDVLGLAQTGTGKTAAFALPILHRLLEAAPRERHALRVVVIAPTRELAAQVDHDFRMLAQYTGLRSMTIYGGVNINPQIRQLEAGVEIAVVCPGRMLDHLGRGTVDVSQVEVLVIDEADRMFDMGFLPDVRRIIRRLPRQRQTMLFSATMPADVRHLAHEILQRPVVIQLEANAPVESVAHIFYPVPERLKTDLLVEILYREQEETRAVLVFTRTKRRARQLAGELEEWGHRVALLEGDLSQFRRRKALEGFREGKYNILVATNIAARGLDVAEITHVINYDVPGTEEAYIHRIGRTGRAERTGVAYTFVTPGDRQRARELEAMLEGPVERRRLEGFDYEKGLNY